MQEIYATDISFIGSTYKEKKNRFYDRLGAISDETKGYLEGLIQAQKNIYGEKNETSDPVIGGISGCVGLFLRMRK